MREKTRRHQQLEILNCRYKLSSYEKEELQKLEAGYKGELIFDELIEGFTRETNIVHLKDYNFYPENIDQQLLTRSKEDAAHVQIDNLILAKDFLYTFEIKNYSFDLNYVDAKWYFENGNEFTDPLIQVVKQRDMLGRLLGSFGHRIRMFNLVVFINENQTIFNLPARNEIIVRSNLKKKLSKAMVNNHYDHRKLVDNLESRRLFDLKYQGDAVVDFQSLEKGVFCVGCGERLVRLNRYWFKCGVCSETVHILEAARRVIEEMKILNRCWSLNPVSVQKFSGGQISDFYIRKHMKNKMLEL